MATLGVYQVPDPSRCGIVTLGADGHIEKFIEKPSNPEGNIAFSGLMIGTQSLLDAIPPRTPVDIGFDLLPRHATQMLAYSIHSYVLDIGTHENYRTAQRTWHN
jgi:NDP-sugar pyrophosphorylase family protein